MEELVVVKQRWRSWWWSSNGGGVGGGQATMEELVVVNEFTMRDEGHKRWWVSSRVSSLNIKFDT
jgi:hypothetical protein